LFDSDVLLLFCAHFTQKVNLFILIDYENQLRNQESRYLILNKYQRQITRNS
jgi:hypothetical protein